MTIGRLLEHGYVKKVGVYTDTVPTDGDDVFIDIYKGSREDIPDAILELIIREWGITRGYVDINVPFESEEEIQAFLNELEREETWLRQVISNAKTQDDKTRYEERRKIVRKVLRNFAKNVNPTPPDH